MKWIVRAIEAAVITVTLAAICQELEKPKAERNWTGKLAFIPYDFRPPTFEKIRLSFWNEDDDRIFSKPLFGVGWAVNFYALLEKMRIIGDFYTTEEDFLMPTESLRRILEKRPAMS